MGCIKASLPAVCTPRDALAEPFRRDPAPDLGGALALRPSRGPPALLGSLGTVTALAETWVPAPGAHSVPGEGTLCSGVVLAARTPGLPVPEAGARPPLSSGRTEQSNRLTEGCG